MQSSDFTCSYCAQSSLGGVVCADMIWKEHSQVRTKLLVILVDLTSNFILIYRKSFRRSLIQLALDSQCLMFRAQYALVMEKLHFHMDLRNILDWASVFFASSLLLSYLVVLS